MDKNTGMQLMFCFGTMTIPMRQWFNYIFPTDYVFLNSNSKIIVSPDVLKCKAFMVWFQTLIDVVRHEPTRKLLLSNFPENSKPKETEYHMDAITRIYKKIASDFVAEEQLFLRDRRLQNVHGHLSQYGGGNIFQFTFSTKKNVLQRKLEFRERTIQPK